MGGNAQTTSFGRAYFFFLLTEMKAQPWRSAWPWSSSRPWRLAHVASQRRLSTNLSTSQKTIGDLAPTLHRLKSVGGSGSRHVLPASASVGAAAHHLLSERLSFSLILRSDESLLGMVTERDLLRYATQAGDLSGRTSSPRAYRVSKPLPSKPAVVEWMTPADRALTVRLDDTLEHAVSLVRRGIWRHLPVVDYYGRIHSILDVRDAVEVVFGARGLDAWRGKTAADVLGHKRKRKLAWPPPGVPFEGWQVPPWDC